MSGSNGGSGAGNTSEKDWGFAAANRTDAVREHNGQKWINGIPTERPRGFFDCEYRDGARLEAANDYYLGSSSYVGPGLPPRTDNSVPGGVSRVQPQPKRDSKTKGDKPDQTVVLHGGQRYEFVAVCKNGKGSEIVYGRRSVNSGARSCRRNPVLSDERAAELRGYCNLGGRTTSRAVVRNGKTLLFTLNVEEVTIAPSDVPPCKDMTEARDQLFKDSMNQLKINDSCCRYLDDEAAKVMMKMSEVVGHEFANAVNGEPKKIPLEKIGSVLTEVKNGNPQGLRKVLGVRNAEEQKKFDEKKKVEDAQSIAESVVENILKKYRKPDTAKAEKQESADDKPKAKKGIAKQSGDGAPERTRNESADAKASKSDQKSQKKAKNDGEAKPKSQNAKTENKDTNADDSISQNAGEKLSRKQKKKLKQENAKQKPEPEAKSQDKPKKQQNDAAEKKTYSLEQKRDYALENAKDEAEKAEIRARYQKKIDRRAAMVEKANREYQERQAKRAEKQAGNGNSGPEPLGNKKLEAGPKGASKAPNGGRPPCPLQGTTIHGLNTERCTARFLDAEKGFVGNGTLLKFKPDEATEHWAVLTADHVAKKSDVILIGERFGFKSSIKISDLRVWNEGKPGDADVSVLMGEAVDAVAKDHAVEPMYLGSYRKEHMQHLAYTVSYVPDEGGVADKAAMVSTVFPMKDDLNVYVESWHGMSGSPVIVDDVVVGVVVSAGWVNGQSDLSRTGLAILEDVPNGEIKWRKMDHDSEPTCARTKSGRMVTISFLTLLLAGLVHGVGFLVQTREPVNLTFQEGLDQINDHLIGRDVLPPGWEVDVWCADAGGMQIPQWLASQSKNFTVHGIWSYGIKNQTWCGANGTVCGEEAIEFANHQAALCSHDKWCAQTVEAYKHEYRKHAYPYNLTADEYFAFAEASVVYFSQRMWYARQCSHRDGYNYIQQAVNIPDPQLVGCVAGAPFKYVNLEVKMPFQLIVNSSAVKRNHTFFRFQGVAHNESLVLTDGGGVGHYDHRAYLLDVENKDQLNYAGAYDDADDVQYKVTFSGWPLMFVDIGGSLGELVDVRLPEAAGLTGKALLKHQESMRSLLGKQWEYMDVEPKRYVQATYFGGDGILVAPTTVFTNNHKKIFLKREPRLVGDWCTQYTMGIVWLAKDSECQYVDMIESEMEALTMYVDSIDCREMVHCYLVVYEAESARQISYHIPAGETHQVNDWISVYEHVGNIRVHPKMFDWNEDERSHEMYLHDGGDKFSDCTVVSTFAAEALVSCKLDHDKLPKKGSPVYFVHDHGVKDFVRLDGYSPRRLIVHGQTLNHYHDKNGSMCFNVDHHTVIWDSSSVQYKPVLYAKHHGVHLMYADGDTLAENSTKTKVLQYGQYRHELPNGTADIVFPSMYNKVPTRYCTDRPSLYTEVHGDKVTLTSPGNEIRARKKRTVAQIVNGTVDYFKGFGKLTLDLRQVCNEDTFERCDVYANVGADTRTRVVKLYWNNCLFVPAFDSLTPKINDSLRWACKNPVVVWVLVALAITLFIALVVLCTYKLCCRCCKCTIKNGCRQLCKCCEREKVLFDKGSHLSDIEAAVTLLGKKQKKGKNKKKRPKADADRKPEPTPDKLCADCGISEGEPVKKAPKRRAKVPVLGHAILSLLFFMVVIPPGNCFTLQTQELTYRGGHASYHAVLILETPLHVGQKFSYDLHPTSPEVTVKPKKLTLEVLDVSCAYRSYLNYWSSDVVKKVINEYKCCSSYDCHKNPPPSVTAYTKKGVKAFIKSWANIFQCAWGYGDCFCCAGNNGCSYVIQYPDNNWSLDKYLLYMGITPLSRTFKYKVCLDNACETYETEATTETKLHLGTMKMSVTALNGVQCDYHGDYVIYDHDVYSLDMPAFGTGKAGTPGDSVARDASDSFVPKDFSTQQLVHPTQPGQYDGFHDVITESGFSVFLKNVKRRSYKPVSAYYAGKTQVVRSGRLGLALSQHDLAASSVAAKIEIENMQFEVVEIKEVLSELHLAAPKNSCYSCEDRAEAMLTMVSSASATVYYSCKPSICIDTAFTVHEGKQELPVRLNTQSRHTDLTVTFALPGNPSVSVGFSSTPPPTYVLPSTTYNSSSAMSQPMTPVRFSFGIFSLIGIGVGGFFGLLLLILMGYCAISACCRSTACIKCKNRRQQNKEEKAKKKWLESESSRYRYRGLKTDFVY